MKSVPKIDITIPTSTVTNQSTSMFKSSATTTTSNSKMTNNFETLSFVTTATPTSKGGAKEKISSDVIVLDDESDEIEDEDDTSDDSSNSDSHTTTSSSNDSMKFKFSSPVPILSKQVPSMNVKSSDSSKNFKFSNPLSVGGQLQSFKPDMSQAKKKVVTQETPEKVIQSPVIAVASELKQGSCLDALFGKKADESGATTAIGFGLKFKMASSQWECPACLIRNDNANEKCVACNSAKPATGPGKTGTDGTSSGKSSTTNTFKTTDTGFANLMAAQKSKWSCPVCMSQNDQSADKCLACTEPKPGGGVAKPSGPKKLEAAVGPVIDDSFKRLVEKQKANWKCESCFTQNEPTRMKCACCEEAKPGSIPGQVPPFSFNSGSTGKYSFGVPKDAAQTTGTSKDLPQSSSGFVFGSVKPTEASKGISFGASPTTVTKADTGAKPTFSFGVPNSTTTVKPTTDMVSSSTVNHKPAVVAGGFNFGVTSSVAAKSEAISSAADTSTSMKKRPLDETDTSKTAPAPATGFTFGKTNEAQAKAFTVPGSSTLVPSTNNTVSSSGGFAFQKPTNPSVTTSTTTATSAQSLSAKDDSNQISSTATTNAITAPIFGSGISAMKPLDRSAFSMKPSSTDDANKNKSTLIFGAAKKDEGIKPTTGGFTFGQSPTQKPADTSSIFGGAAAAAKTSETGNKPGFSFMSSADKSGENKTAATPAFGMFGNAGTVSKFVKKFSDLKWSSKNF